MFSQLDSYSSDSSISSVSIHTIAENGNFEKFKHLVDLDINLIDSVDDFYGRTPLIICSFKKSDSHFKIAEYLLDCGCDVNVQANYKWNNWTALMTACHYGNTRMVEMLINANVNLELMDINSNTAWQLALENSYSDCVQIILNEMETKQIELRLKLEKDLQDAVFNNDFEQTKLCISKINKQNIKQLINSTSSGNHTLLYRACRNGNSSIVNLLIENGAIAKPHYYTKYSPLYIACHMGNIEISKLILQKFPHLIQVTTIEKFLPFHAVCSQGHLDILKLLINYDMDKYLVDSSLLRLHADVNGNKYVCSFDLNALDVNDQSGLYASVQANRYDICEYLLNLKIKKLSEDEINEFEKLHKQNHQDKRKNSNETNNASTVGNNGKLYTLDASQSFSSAFLSFITNDIEPNSLASGLSSSVSFFDQLKNVFLDVKPSQGQESIYLEANDIKVSNSPRLNKSSISLTKNEQVDSTKREITFHFNPINLNNYSKFGFTCLHEAIRIKNFSLVNLLIKHGADVNLPIYDVNSSSSIGSKIQNKLETEKSDKKIISNCLCEALKQFDENIFCLLLDKYVYNDLDFKLALDICLKFMETKKTYAFGKKMISYLMQFKIINDLEYKINLKNKLSTKLINSLFPHISVINSANLNDLFSSNFDNGLILNWNNCEPKLSKVYESWLLSSVKYFKFSPQNVNTSTKNVTSSVNNEFSFKNHSSSFHSANDLGSSQNDLNDPSLLQTLSSSSSLSLKKIHLHVITRIDFSYNSLEHLPICIFQIESIKFMKLSFNFLKQLPTTKNNELDDVNNSNNINKPDYVLNWSCHSLEELDIDNNQLTDLPAQIFQIKSLKHLNLSNNNLEKLPIEIWQAPALYDLNLSHNKLKSLPIFSNSSCFKDVFMSRNRSQSSPMQPISPKHLASSRSRREDANTNTKHQIHIKRGVPVQDHPLKSPSEEKDSIFPSKRPTQQPLLPSFEDKSIVKANFWQINSILSSSGSSAIYENAFENEPANNEETTQNEKNFKSRLKQLNQNNQSSSNDLFQTSQQATKISKLIELNLSHNQFLKMPACLSCLTPKLVKLNLSFNKIESMGAICDLPTSLKFLDLSNNFIKRPMRLLNENLLKIIISYFNSYENQPNASNAQANYKQNFIEDALLENEFCYSNLIKYFSNKANELSGQSSLSITRSKLMNSRASDQNQQQQTQQQQIQSQTKQPEKRSTSKRRTRSQSRNHRIVMMPQQQNFDSEAKLNTSSSSSAANRRLIPFDLFLINVRYNRAYMSSTNKTDNTENKEDLDLKDWDNTENDEAAMLRHEKLLLNTQNLQIFLEQLCPHKRHIKLENLKSLNLSQNKLKKCSLMFDLDSNSLENYQEGLNSSLPVSSSSKQFVSALSSSLSSSLLLAESNRLLNTSKSSKPSSNKQSTVSSNASNEEYESVKSNYETPTSESDLSDESENLTSEDESGYYKGVRISSTSTPNQSEKQSDNFILAEIKKNRSSNAKNKLKDKFSNFSPLKKKPNELFEINTENLKTQRRRKKKYSNKNDERASMIAKLMYPNLTHFDISANRLKRLTGNISFLENLSYLNASSNSQLTRISPQIGLLNKLWNFDLKNCVNLREPVMLDTLVNKRTKTSDILGFLKSILEHSRPYTRIKLMFVGVQAIGKTSLLNKLREEGSTNPNRSTWSERSNNSNSSSSSSHNGPNISTVGIDINEWIYEKPKVKATVSLLSSSAQQQYMQQQVQLQQPQSFYVYQIDDSNNSLKNFGPITYRTWDFGGQREYYSTHQYFISKRALYLVCWKLTEEEKGINEIHHWLSNIQTRAPGSPVIIVGTHQDQLARLKNYKDISTYLQRIIYDRFVKPTSETEATSAYPPVMASIEISSKTGYNIKLLARLIYDVSMQMKTPGIKDQLLLEQKIPVTYLALEECINYVVYKLKSQSRNPVLNTNNYLKEVKFAMDSLYPEEQNEKQIGNLNINELVTTSNRGTPNNRGLSNKKKRILIRFRDDAEILQATQFLHENGILIHYNDVALRDLYFLDPQWLCDLLATVVTIREINPFGTKGIMKIKDLLILFKGSRFVESEEIMNFIVDLLGKFELALTWDNEHLLIPSLLPSEGMLKYANQDIRIGIISKQKAYTERLNAISFNNLVSSDSHQINIKTVKDGLEEDDEEFSSKKALSIIPSSASCKFLDNSPQVSSVKMVNSFSQMSFQNNKINVEFLYECKPYVNDSKASNNRLNYLKENENDFTVNQLKIQNSVRRLYCLNYLPNGFFSRLITRILSDSILKECLLELIELEYCLFDNGLVDQTTAKTQPLDSLIDFIGQEAEWKCWQSGIELKYLDYTLIRVKELVQDPLVDFTGSSASNSSDNSSTSKTQKNVNDVFLNNSVLYRDCENEFKLKTSTKNCSFLECYASFRDYKIIKSKPKASCIKSIKKKLNTLDDDFSNKEKEDKNDDEDDILVKILCNKQICIKIFALIIEIIDSLLEDWYPDLGTRFMQDSKGDYLVTRLTPCSDCVRISRQKLNQQQEQKQKLLMSSLKESNSLFMDFFSLSTEEPLSPSSVDSRQSLSASHSSYDTNNWRLTDVDEKFKLASVQSDNISLLMDSNGNDFLNNSFKQQNISRSASNSFNANEADSFGKSDYLDLTEDDKTKLKTFENTNWIFCFMIDDISYSVLKNSPIKCPKHGMQIPRVIAPDLAFEDIEDRFIIPAKNLKIESLLGRGSFGSVYMGSLLFLNNENNQTADRSKVEEKKIKVAVKVLETLSSNADKTFNNDRPTVSPKKSIQAKEESKTAENNSINNEIKKTKELFNKNWNYRKSIRLAAKAYTIARQEIAIISSLKHENIVPMIGLSIQPLAIILELAPLGNLKDILTEYKKNMCKLNPIVIQRVCTQISSALVYLHSNRIIYRDLKADNVLVWKFPRANQLYSQVNTNNLTPDINVNVNNVYLKLADYSISRSVLPTGTKGFAGTPGFMAPEILKFNGEETYSEKVDCFSFAMLLYEIISLKHPFEGQEQIKDIILNGGRPLIKSQDLFYPTLMLDLMCLCWLDNPSERPSAVDILKYTKSYEFSHLLDVTILEDYEQKPLVVSCLNQEIDETEELEYLGSNKDGSNVYGDFYNKEEATVEDEEIEDEDIIDVWVVRNSVEEGSSQFEILTYENKLNCTNRKSINVCNQKIEALCVYNSNQIWCVDSSKSVFIYCCKTYRKLHQYYIDTNSKSEVISIHPMESDLQIILVTSNGQIIFIKTDELHKLSQNGNKIEQLNLNEELEYILYDLSIKIFTSIILPTRYDKSLDLWLGSENSEIHCFSLKSMKLTGSYLHSSSHHYLTSTIVNSTKQQSESTAKSATVPSEHSSSNVTLLKTSQNDTFFLWSYVYPGSTIFLWNHVSKKIMSAYNCRKALDELVFKANNVSNREFRLVDMTFLNGLLYCGISTGVVLVFKRLTLTPLFAFHSHMHQLYTLCPLTFETKLTTIHYNTNNIMSNRQNAYSINMSIRNMKSYQSTTVVKKTQSLLLSLGRALAPLHEDLYLSSSRYRVDALRKYANCVIMNLWSLGQD